MACGPTRVAQAARCYAGVLKQSETDDGHFWFEYAALLLLSGDGDGYLGACARTTGKRCGKARSLRLPCRPRFTSAAASKAELDAVGRRAEAELKNNAGEFWSLLQQGALAQRAGLAEKATGLLHRSLALEKPRGPRDGDVAVAVLARAGTRAAHPGPPLAGPSDHCAEPPCRAACRPRGARRA